MVVSFVSILSVIILQSLSYSPDPRPRDSTCCVNLVELYVSPDGNDTYNSGGWNYCDDVNSPCQTWEHAIGNILNDYTDDYPENRIEFDLILLPGNYVLKDSTISILSDQSTTIYIYPHGYWSGSDDWKQYNYTIDVDSRPLFELNPTRDDGWIREIWFKIYAVSINASGILFYGPGYGIDRTGYHIQFKEVNLHARKGFYLTYSGRYFRIGSVTAFDSKFTSEGNEYAIYMFATRWQEMYFQGCTFIDSGIFSIGDWRTDIWVVDCVFLGNSQVSLNFLNTLSYDEDALREYFYVTIYDSIFLGEFLTHTAVGLITSKKYTTSNTDFEMDIQGNRFEKKLIGVSVTVDNVETLDLDTDVHFGFLLRDNEFINVEAAVFTIFEGNNINAKNVDFEIYDCLFDNYLSFYENSTGEGEIEYPFGPFLRFDVHHRDNQNFTLTVDNIVARNNNISIIGNTHGSVFQINFLSTWSKANLSILVDVSNSLFENLIAESGGFGTFFTTGFDWDNTKRVYVFENVLFNNIRSVKSSDAKYIQLAPGNGGVFLFDGKTRAGANENFAHELYCYDCVFENIHSEGDGGIIFAEEDKHLIHLDNCTVRNSASDGNGGFMSSEVLVTVANIDGNSDDFGIHLYVFDSLFENITSKKNGGVFYFASPYPVASFENSVMRNNVAKENGGAFVVTSTFFQLNDQSFGLIINNTAELLGGAAFIKDTTVAESLVDSCCFERNQALEFGNGLVGTPNKFSLKRNESNVCNPHAENNDRFRYVCHLNAVVFEDAFSNEFPNYVTSFFGETYTFTVTIQKKNGEKIVTNPNPISGNAVSQTSITFYLVESLNAGEYYANGIFRNYSQRFSLIFRDLDDGFPMIVLLPIIAGVVCVFCASVVFCVFWIIFSVKMCAVVAKKLKEKKNTQISAVQDETISRYFEVLENVVERPPRTEGRVRVYKRQKDEIETIRKSDNRIDKCGTFSETFQLDKNRVCKLFNKPILYSTAEVAKHVEKYYIESKKGGNCNNVLNILEGMCGLVECERKCVGFIYPLGRNSVASLIEENKLSGKENADETDRSLEMKILNGTIMAYLYLHKKFGSLDLNPKWENVLMHRNDRVAKVFDYSLRHLYENSDPKVDNSIKPFHATNDLRTFEYNTVFQFAQMLYQMFVLRTVKTESEGGLSRKYFVQEVKSLSGGGFYVQLMKDIVTFKVKRLEEVRKYIEENQDQYIKDGVQNELRRGDFERPAYVCYRSTADDGDPPIVQSDGKDVCLTFLVRSDE